MPSDEGTCCTCRPRPWRSCCESLGTSDGRALARRVEEDEVGAGWPRLLRCLMGAPFLSAVGGRQAIMGATPRRRELGHEDEKGPDRSGPFGCNRAVPDCLVVAVQGLEPRTLRI